MARLFGKNWVRKVLGTDSILGRSRLRSSITRSVAAALIGGMMLTSWPSVVKAATPEQRAAVVQIQRDLDGLNGPGDPNVKKVTDSTVKIIFALFKQFEEELESMDYEEAAETSNMAVMLAKAIGLEEKVKQRLSTIKSAVFSRTNQNATKKWEEAFARRNTAKKEGRRIEFYKLTIKGSNWLFQVTHSPLGGDVNGKLMGNNNIKLSEIDEALKKSGLSQDQQDHAKAVILRFIERDMKSVILIP